MSPTLPQLVAIVAIVDDDSGVRGSLNSLLRSAGIESKSFESAEDLLAYEELDTLGCIVSDLHMPGMDGLELQRELSRRAWPGPLIIMTAYPTDAARERALEGGAEAFLVKPVDPDQLLDTIEVTRARG